MTEKQKIYTIKRLQSIKELTASKLREKLLEYPNSYQYYFPRTPQEVFNNVKKVFTEWNFPSYQGEDDKVYFSIRVRDFAILNTKGFKDKVKEIDVVNNKIHKKIKSLNDELEVISDKVMLGNSEEALNAMEQFSKFCKSMEESV
jgi:hypothetical protein